MRTIAASGIALALTACSAFADGLPAPPPGYEPAVYSWSGFYFGVNGGYGWASATGNYGHDSGSGAIAGGQIGFNWQTGKLVLGMEIDSQWSGQKTKDLVCAFMCGTTLTDSVDYFGTGRIRLGAAFDRALVYATGGAAWTHVSTTMGAGIGTANGGGFGWTVGSGAELAMTNNVSLTLEYLFIDTPGVTLLLPGGVPSSSFELRDSIARVGLNVRFPAN